MIILERRDSKRAAISASDITSTSLIRTLDLIYSTFVLLIGLVLDALSYSRGGKLVVQVLLNKAGASRAACRRVTGVSVGVSISLELVKRWEGAWVAGVDWHFQHLASMEELDVQACSARLRSSDGRLDDA